MYVCTVQYNIMSAIAGHPFGLEDVEFLLRNFNGPARPDKLQRCLKPRILISSVHVTGSCCKRVS